MHIVCFKINKHISMNDITLSNVNHKHRSVWVKQIMLIESVLHNVELITLPILIHTQFFVCFRLFNTVHFLLFLQLSLMFLLVHCV